jgi:DNA-binding GntR family transcriptional regulator
MNDFSPRYYAIEPLADVLEGDLGSQSVFAMLARVGLVPPAGRAAISSEAATAEDAKLLGVKRGEPLLVERRLIADQAGVPLELTEKRYDVELEWSCRSEPGRGRDALARRPRRRRDSLPRTG